MSQDTNKKNQNTEQVSHPKGSKGQRIAALLCIVLLVSLYIVTLVVAIFDRSASQKWFMLCLLGTIVIPLLTWIYIWMYGVLTQKHTIASFQVNEPDAEQEQVQEEES